MTVFFTFLALLLTLPYGWSAWQGSTRLRLVDKSDWWSIGREPDSEDEIKAQERELSSSNFRALGVALGDEMFVRAAAKLGKATIVERGDAASGRTQECYVSVQPGKKVHFILEQGEVNLAFYLFEDGPQWQGEERCTKSSLVSANAATASGLHLGQTPAQVIAILGKPNLLRKNQLSYSLHVKKKTSPEDLEKIRSSYPKLSDQEFHDNYDYYDLSANVNAKFVDSRLTYLAISKLETN